MVKSVSFIFPMSFTNGIQKLNHWFSEAVGVTNNIWSELYQCLIYMNPYIKFYVSSSYNIRDLCVHTDIRTDPNKENIHFKPPSAYNKHLHKVGIPFFEHFQWLKGIKIVKKQQSHVGLWYIRYPSCHIKFPKKIYVHSFMPSSYSRPC